MLTLAIQSSWQLECLMTSCKISFKEEKTKKRWKFG